MATVVNSITGRHTVGGAGEETIPLVVDGAAATANVVVASGSRVIIKDVIVTATAAANFFIQQDNGSGSFDIFIVRQPTDGTGGVSPLGQALTIRGSDGASVSYRARVDFPGGSGDATVTLRGYTRT